MNKVSNRILLRIYLLFGIFLFAGMIVLFRIMGLQLNKQKWMQLEVEEKVYFKKVVADRGSILSDKGELMAVSLPFYKVGMDPTVIDTTAVPFFRDSLMQLSALVAENYQNEYWDTLTVNDTLFIPFKKRDTLKVYHDITKAMREGDRHIYLFRQKIDFRDLKKVKTWPILNMGRFKGGLVVEKFQNRRYYPYGDLAKITLGTMRQDTLGIRGIEASFNKQLRGKDGYMLAQKVAGDLYIPLDKYGEGEDEDGWDIVTTLDVDMQDVVYKALKQGVENYRAQHGTAILLEVNTGKIKAIANYPETYNHAVASSIEPGSTFKLASAVAVLGDSIVSPTDTIDTGNGKTEYDEWVISDDAAYGKIPFKKVFARSSNVGMSKVIVDSYGEQPEKYIDHLKDFGFFDSTGIKLLGEPKSTIYQPGDDVWNIATLPSMAYGYSLRVTALQMAAFYNAIANRGKRMKPWLVKEVWDNAKLKASYGPEVMHEEICSEKSIDHVWELMEAVVINGTAAKAFKNMPFRVAGKTGTVRKNIDGKYQMRYRSSFGGFFPLENPRYTCYIVIDDPQGKRIGGGTVAAPIFREIAEEIYSMDVQLAKIKDKEEPQPSSRPNMRKVHSSSAEIVYAELGIPTSGVSDTIKWIKAKNNGHQLNLEKFEPGKRRIPDFRGMTVRDAVNILENMGVSVELQGVGRVKQQSLQPGYIIGKNTSIKLYSG